MYESMTIRYEVYLCMYVCMYVCVYVFLQELCFLRYFFAVIILYQEFVNKHTLLTEVMFHSLLDLIAPRHADNLTCFSPPETFTQDSNPSTISSVSSKRAVPSNSFAKASSVTLTSPTDIPEIPSFIPNALVVTSAAALLESIGRELLKKCE